MALLSAEKKRQIITTLGYHWSSNNLFPQLELDYPSDVISKIDELISSLATSKQQKRSAFGNIQLKKVDEIEFQALKDSNYLDAFEKSNHEILSQLSDLVSIPLAYGYVHRMPYQ